MVTRMRSTGAKRERPAQSTEPVDRDSYDPKSYADSLRKSDALAKAAGVDRYAMRAARNGGVARGDEQLQAQAFLQNQRAVAAAAETLLGSEAERERRRRRGVLST